MNRFEYKIIEKLDTCTVSEYYDEYERAGHRDTALARRTFEESTLKILGEDGWELCGTNKKNEFIFKRQILAT